MIRNTRLSSRTFYRPLRGTPPVCLTQDLIPELDADILLLGCGDARNILFTLYTDSKRKFDITCCDIEPGIHARNILLYTLLIDDIKNLNTDKIWNVYFHLKLDRDSSELLQTQVQKLLKISESIEQWHNSVYGPNIRFFDAKSLLAVRQYWQGFVPQDIRTSQKDSEEHKKSQGGNSRSEIRQKNLDKNNKTDMRQKQLQDTIESAVDLGISRARHNKNQRLHFLRSVFPATNYDALTDLYSVTDHWWKRGTLPSSTASNLEPTDLNPALLYTPNPYLTLHLWLPLNGFPLSTAYTPIVKGSAFFVKKKATSSSKQYLVDCAQNHFMLWASAFRKSVANRLVLRIFAEDALSFCFTLRNHHLAQSKSVEAAPLSFDIIDTSNLADALGPLNVMTLASSLLKYHDTSCLYAKMLVHYDAFQLPDRLNTIFGVDIRCMSLFLGLVPPDLFTNATNRLEEEQILLEVSKTIIGGEMYLSQVVARMRWRRIKGAQKMINNSPFLNVEHEALSKFLVQVYNAMFCPEVADFNVKKRLADEPSAVCREIYRLCNPLYNCASFAFLLRVLKDNIVCDWKKCLENIFSGIKPNDCQTLYSGKCKEELILHLHLFGVNDSQFCETNIKDPRGSILAAKLPADDLPDLMCITIRVRKEYLRFITNKEPKNPPPPVITCTLEGKDPKQWSYVFSSLQCTFGKWHDQTTDDISYPYIEEDILQIFGTSDLFISVIVPTWMLVQSKENVPLVKCGLFLNNYNAWFFSQDLGADLIFFTCAMTSEDVFITRFMPGSSALPTFASFSKLEDNQNSDRTTVQLSDNGLQIKSLVKRVCLKSKVAQRKFAMKSTAVKVDFKSLFYAHVIIWISIDKSLEFKVEFPVPVSKTQHKIRIVRKLLYVEVESPIFNPLKEESARFVFPTFLAKTPAGVTVPTPWTASHLDLDAMPQIDLNDPRAIPWLEDHCNQMYSKYEALLRHRSLSKCAVIGIPNHKIGKDLRLKMKMDLASLFLNYAGVDGNNNKCFALCGLDKTLRILVYPFCLRFDLGNYNIVLDCAIFPSVKKTDSKMIQFFRKNSQNGGLLAVVPITEDDNRVWTALMPALVERCRNWQHTPDCEYAVFEEVPSSGEFSIPICSCGIGQFPMDNLGDHFKRYPSLKCLLERYAVRAAISPIFPVPYVEECTVLYPQNCCETCRIPSKVDTIYLKRISLLLLLLSIICYSLIFIFICVGLYLFFFFSNGFELILMTCPNCKIVTYCSGRCQKKDWHKHKPFCKFINEKYN